MNPAANAPIATCLLSAPPLTGVELALAEAELDEPPALFDEEAVAVAEAVAELIVEVEVDVIVLEPLVVTTTTWVVEGLAEAVAEVEADAEELEAVGAEPEPDLVRRAVV